MRQRLLGITRAQTGLENKNAHAATSHQLNDSFDLDLQVFDRARAFAVSDGLLPDPLGQLRHALLVAKLVPRHALRCLWRARSGPVPHTPTIVVRALKVLRPRAIEKVTEHL